jgi:polysaccharide export outer membrane protein
MRRTSPGRAVRHASVPRAVAAALLFTLGACTTLPIDGPLISDVRDELALRHRMPFHLVQLTPDILSVLEEEKPEVENFITDLGPSEPRIGPGDTLAVTIVEPSAGGLFSGPPSINNTGAEPGARVVTLPESTIDSDGRVNVPFAGTMQVSGLTNVEAADRIRSALSGQAIAPQVMVNTIHNVASRVTVSGAVKNPGMLPILAGGETILEAVARAGGSADPAESVVVQLNRFGNVHRVRMTTLLEQPDTNIHVRSGDYLHLLNVPQSYVVLGAADKVDERHLGIKAEKLDNALAQSGGLMDGRADARSVMLFRTEPPAVMDRITAVEAREARERGDAAPIPVSVPRHGPADAPVPVILMINLRSGSGLFLSRNMTVRDSDLIYAPDADYTQLQKFLDLIRMTVSPVSGGVVTGKAL